MPITVDVAARLITRGHAPMRSRSERRCWRNAKPLRAGVGRVNMRRGFLQALHLRLLLFFTFTVLVGASSVPASARSIVAIQRDPLHGFHFVDEASHAKQLPLLTPKRTDLIQRAQPRVSNSAASASAANPVLKREVFGFATYWELPNEPTWNYNLVSTVAYFGLDVRGDGTFDSTTPGWNGWNSQQLVNLINHAHQAGDRVVLVIKQFDASVINQIVTNAASTQVAITGTVNAIASQNLDGVNVDFEGTSSGYPNVQSGMTNFMTQLSSQVHQRWPTAEVSMDTYSGSASWDGGIFNIQTLAPVVDSFFVMGYDMVFGNMSNAGPNAPLNGWTYNDTSIVAQYLSKAPASKVILGVPYYGYKWCTTGNQPYGQVTCAPTAETYADAQADIACAQANGLQLSQSWDSTAQSPWAAWYSPAVSDPCSGNYGSWRELYYDNAQSLGMKYDLVNSNNLRGTGMWALGYDGTQTDLWNQIAVKFTNLMSWTSLGGGFSSGPGAASWGAGRLDAFATGLDGALWHIAWTGTAWSGWQSLGGGLTSSPAAVSWGSGRIDVFARGQDNAMWHIAWDGAAWSGWQSLGGGFGSGPAAASWSTGRLDVFARGEDNALWRDVWDGSTWSGWQSLGGGMLSDPGAVSWGPNRIDVFIRGMDSQLWHLAWTGASWSGWQPLGGYITSGVGVSSWSAGRLDVFARGSDSALWHRTWDGTSWLGWETLGGGLSSGPAAVSWGPNRIDVFARGGDNALWHKAWDGIQWTS
jgi:hypothetical protein